MAVSGGALDGIRVADFSRVLAGPYATMVLADLGAEVIKIERPGGGDDTRRWLPPTAPDGQATYFHSVNRNKHSVSIDLSGSRGRVEAQDIISASDVVVENFLPGTMERFGLGYGQVSARFPALVYCSITGFGSGAGAELPGYDLLVQAMGGLMSITGTDEADPTKVGVALVDVLTGLHAAVGILAALRHRDATGQGQHVEVNLLSTLLASMVNQSAAFVIAGQEPGILGNAHPSIAPYEVFAAGDRPIVIAVGNDGQFRALVEELGAPDLAVDPRFVTNADRVRHRGELKNELDARLSREGAETWRERLQRVGVPCGPINSVAQAFALAQRLGLAPIQHIETDGMGVPTVSNPIGLSRTPVTYRLSPPNLGRAATIGENTDEERKSVR